MRTIPAQEIKRRGMGVMDAELTRGPVHVLKNNRPRYVVMVEEDYQTLLDDLAEARLSASERDIAAGRVRRGSPRDLMAEIMSSEEDQGGV
jgi:PHD/YefM family antitoxin component YafN of YafNO toxin-antitoxin module